jgi:hypothetical protein
MTLSLPVAQAEAISESSLKAAIVYKLAQFTDWPPPPFTEFNLCLIGKDVFEGELVHLIDKNLQQTKIIVTYLSNISDAETCQLLFMSPANSSQLSSWQAQIKTLPILTISDNPNAWDQDIMIVLSTEPNRIVFSINKSAAQKVGIAFRAQMLRIARMVK